MIKLRKGSKCFVADPNDSEFGKRIPLICRYHGRHPEGLLFIIEGDDIGYWLTEKMVAKLVEPYSKAREAEVDKAAGKYLEGGQDRGEAR
jgi:hypothetical protein